MHINRVITIINIVIIVNMGEYGDVSCTLLRVLKDLLGKFGEIKEKY